METYKIWNKKDEIKGVSAEYVIKSHNIKDYDEVFLVIDACEVVTQIQIVSTIKSVYGFDANLTAEETAQAYLDLKKEEENNIIKEQENLEDQAKKIDILEAENADLLLDSTNKDIKLKSLEKDLADLTLTLGGM